MNYRYSLVGSQVAVTVAFLFYSSWSDYKTREVSNRVWAIYAPIAIALSLSDLLLFDPSKLVLFGVSVGFTVGLAFVLFYFGAFGGADSKALMCIAFSLPFAPVVLFTPILANSLSPISQVIYPMTIFSNGVLFAAASCVYMVLRNFVWHRRNGKEMFSGGLAKESLEEDSCVDNRVQSDHRQAEGEMARFPDGRRRSRRRHRFETETRGYPQ